MYLRVQTTDGTPVARLFADDSYAGGFPNDADLLLEDAWIIAGSSRTQAVAQVVDISDGVVHVRPLPGSVASHRSLLSARKRG